MAPLGTDERSARDASRRRKREAAAARNRRREQAASRAALFAQGQWPACPYRGCDRPAGKDGGACCGRHAEAIKARRRAREQGHVLVPDAARKLGVPATVLRRLRESGDLAGRVVDGDIWLDRRQLAAWAFSRPRCIVESCGRRVLGIGPGCTRHSNHGKRRSAETRDAMSERMSAYWQSEQGQQERARRSETSEPPVRRMCEWCEEPFELSAAQARQQPGRFCSRPCADEWHRDVLSQPSSLEQLRAGRRRWRAEVVELKAETGLRDVDHVVATLRREGVPRSSAALRGTRGYIAKGWLKPTPNELGIWLFTDEAIAQLVAYLRDLADGRSRRFNATNDPLIDDRRSRAKKRPPRTRATFRGTWFQARHKSAAEFGRVAPVLAAARGKRAGPKPKLAAEEEALIRKLRADGKLQKEIVHEVGVTRKQVRRVLAQGG